MAAALPSASASTPPPRAHTPYPKVHDVPEAPEGSKDPEGDIRKSMMKQTWDWLPRYLRHEIDNTTLHAPRRSWMTGCVGEGPGAEVHGPGLEGSKVEGSKVDGFQG